MPPSSHEESRLGKSTRCTLLIIGAGPYGLAMASLAKHLGIDFAIVGEPFSFWREHTPPGMLLRSGSEWHIDPLERHTIQHYERHQLRDSVETQPLSREVFLDYLQWFTEQKGLQITATLVRTLQHVGDRFVATLADGQTITAKLAVVASGAAPFYFCPRDLVKHLPAGRYSHTIETVNFGSLKCRRCLIVGGRQSAFEWAALIAEQGATAIHMAYPHPTPAFRVSDWSWVKPCLEQTIAIPRWFRNLDATERERLEQRFWSEGRLKLEPWLEERILRPEISLHPESRILNGRLLPNGSLEIELSDDSRVVIDHVILATGYRMDLGRIDFLNSGSLGGAIAVELGYPQLDEHFQSSVPGLFFAGFASTRAFGPFFGFLVGAPVTAKIIGRFIASQASYQ